MNIINIVFGNICSLLAMVTDSISSTRKTATGVLWVQNASQLFYCIGAVVLKGYSGAVQNVVSVVRNLVVIYGVNSKLIEWILLILGVILGLVFNNLGWVGLLPVIANLQYTLAVFRFHDNERAIKISFLLSAVMFSVFSVAIINIVGLFTNLVVAVTTTVFLTKTKASV